MAEGHRMTAADLVDKLMADEHADVLRDSVAWLVEELMNAEATALAGAELGEFAGGRVLKSQAEQEKCALRWGPEPAPLPCVEHLRGC